MHDEVGPSHGTEIAGQRSTGEPPTERSFDSRILSRASRRVTRGSVTLLARMYVGLRTTGAYVLDDDAVALVDKRHVVHARE